MVAGHAARRDNAGNVARPRHAGLDRIVCGEIDHGRNSGCNGENAERRCASPRAAAATTLGVYHYLFGPPDCVAGGATFGLKSSPVYCISSHV